MVDHDTSLVTDLDASTLSAHRPIPVFECCSIKDWIERSNAFKYGAMNDEIRRDEPSFEFDVCFLLQERHAVVEADQAPPGSGARNRAGDDAPSSTARITCNADANHSESATQS